VDREALDDGAASRVDAQQRAGEVQDPERTGARGHAERRHPGPKLTTRQRELLYLVAAGHTNGQIARRLGLTEGTVRTHLENIYRLLQVSSRTAAVTRAFAGPAS